MLLREDYAGPVRRAVATVDTLGEFEVAYKSLCDVGTIASTSRCRAPCRGDGIDRSLAKSHFRAWGERQQDSQLVEGRFEALQTVAPDRTVGAMLGGDSAGRINRYANPNDLVIVGTVARPRGIGISNGQHD